jgi:segregation and condensation protein B
MPVDAQLLRQIIEGALLAAGQPLTVARLLELFDEAVAPSKEEVLAALDEIADDNAARGFELKEVASGYRLQVRKELAPWVNRLWEEKPQKYSRALLETLALIAYRQPITRGDIEEIRGVAVSSHIMKTLMERDWIKVVGQRDVPGRPSLYATTRQFLDYFNLKSLDQLPSLSEIRDIDSLNADLNAELDLGDIPEAAHAEEPENIEREFSDENIEQEVADEDGEEAFENMPELQETAAQPDTDEDYRSL